MRFSRVVLGSVALALSSVSGAAAQDAGIDCEHPPTFGPDRSTPANTARGVTLDAPVLIHYSPEGYFEATSSDPTTLIQIWQCPTDGCDFLACAEGVGTFVPGRVQVLGDQLAFLPDSPWLPEQTYYGVARGQDIPELPFTFCTGTTIDDAPPVIGPLGEVTSTAVGASCEAPDGGFRIGVYFPPATDGTAPGASIEYLLFQTRGPGIEEPILRSAVRNYNTETITMAFNLPPEEATGFICVRVAAVDGLGNLQWSEPNPDTDCVDPVQGNFFYPLCTVSAPGRGGSATLALFVLSLFAFFLRRRRLQ